MENKFRLTDNFLASYKTRKAPFGFNGLGEIVYMRTYSRIKPDGKNENWWETVARVVEGTFNMQKKWIEGHQLGWSSMKAQKSAQEMYNRIFTMRFLPPGRGLWAMGAPIIEERGMYMALNNCAFVSTANLAEDLAKPFCFLMDVSMLGVGCGFDLKGVDKVKVYEPATNGIVYQIADTRESWVESVKLLIESYFNGSKGVAFDYKLVRPAGILIKGFGGYSSGPEPLQEMHQAVRLALSKNVGKGVTATTIVDIMNLIGKCVVAGNVRRTAEIVFGDYNSDEYLDLKNYKLNPKREAYGWTSNNSIFCDLGMDYSKAATRTQINGEPGYAWLENMKGYSRMNNGKDNKDHRVTGGNPCQPKDAIILKKSGLATFDTLKVGDEIWSAEGWTKVIKKWSTGIKPVYKYHTTAGYFLGTENHKVLSDGIKVEVKEADSLDTLTGYYEAKPKIDPQDVIDGLVLGDGTVHKASGNLIGLLIGENDTSYLNSEIQDFIIARRPGVTKGFYTVKTTITADELPLTFNRVIPDRYFINRIKSIGLLRGLYSANGSVVRNRVTFKTTSSTLREQVQILLSSLGIRSYFTTNKPTTVSFTNGDYLCKESYDINITLDRQKFINCIGFIQPYKNEKIAEASSSKGKVSYDIIKIEEIGEQEVFDITVDNQEHTYWTAGINVSNCLEQSLESYEVCNLVETFPNNHESLEDYIITLKYAYLYAKTVTLGQTHWSETNRVMLRNRRIGCSMSGIAQFMTSRGINTLKQWCEEGYKAIERYDEVYSDWLAIPKSIKKTSIKPSGTVSLLAGATPGIHFPENRYYIRRVRLSKQSDMILPLKEAGYKLEPCYGSEDSTVVVEIPVKIEEDVRTVREVSIWEQIALVAFMQRYWADNQVSCTVSFKKDEGDQIKHVLDIYQYQLKGISFLPLSEGVAAYRQMPYEAITEKKYEELVSKLGILRLRGIKNEEADIEKFCTNDVCQLSIKK